jgi:hypothetical protein
MVYGGRLALLREEGTVAAKNSGSSGKDPAGAADNPAEALVEAGADFVPDGTGDPNKTDPRVEVHASISEGMNSENKTSGTGGPDQEARGADKDAGRNPGREGRGA